MKHRWMEAVAVLLALILLAAGGVIWSVSTVRIYDGPATVPSTAATGMAGRSGAPVADSRRLVRELVAGDNLTGLSVAVSVDGQPVWAEGFGWIDVDTQSPVTPQTRFRLGALSKPLTAVAAAVLHDRGRLDLDAPIQRYVPAYPEQKWPVTTRQLMGDVAGVHRIRGDNNDAMPSTHCERLDDAVGLLAGDPLLFEPGTQHRYSIWGWILVSAVVEGAAREPFARVMERQVLEPLAMSRTLVAGTADLETAHQFQPPRTVLGVRLSAREAAPPDYSCLAGAGAFTSTPTDLVRLGAAMLQPGLLRAETIAEFETPTRLTSGAATAYALGWTVTSVQLGGQPTRMVSHRGSPMGGSVSLLTFPDFGIAVAAAANVGQATGVDPLALRIAEAFARDRRR
jgi:serine beta-lactamase-like protein LACTB